MRKTERIARTVVNSNKSPEFERFIRVLGTIEGFTVETKGEKTTVSMVKKNSLKTKGSANPKRLKHRIRIGAMRDSVVNTTEKNSEKEYRLVSAIIADDNE